MSDHYWYTNGAEFPIEVELMAHGSRDSYWKIRRGDKEFEAFGDNIVTSEREAWSIYLRWARSVRKYLDSFGIQEEFFVMQDLYGRLLHARTRIEDIDEEWIKEREG